MVVALLVGKGMMGVGMGLRCENVFVFFWGEGGVSVGVWSGLHYCSVCLTMKDGGCVYMGRIRGDECHEREVYLRWFAVVIGWIGRIGVREVKSKPLIITIRLAVCIHRF